MAKENTPEPEVNEEAVVEPPKQKLNLKVFIYGVPLFVLQLIFVYYITANVILTRFEHNSAEGEDKEESEEVMDTATAILGQHIYSVDDIIINPAGTDGKKLLLTSLGFDVNNEESLKELESKEILVKDLIISTISGKSLEKLKNWSYKDSLRVEIANNLQGFLPAVKINKVYFSKFIIQ